MSPYVGMARKQNGGYNASISVQTLIFHLVVNSDSFAVAIDIANVLHLGLWTASTSPPTHFLYTSPTLTYKEPLPEQQVDDPPCKWAGNRAIRRGPESKMQYVCDIDRDCEAIRIHHQVKYQRLNANTCIVAAILFSGHPYIGRHYRAP